MRAIEAEPSRGLNKLVVVDVSNGELRILTNADQHFSPSWSPDGRSIAVVADRSKGVLFGGPTATELAILDLDTGAERRIDTPRRYVGSPKWSPDGSRLMLVSKLRRLGFRSLEIYSPKEGSWRTLATPGGMSIVDGLWSVRGDAIIVKLADRFGDTVWRLDADDLGAEQLASGDLGILAFDVGVDGDMVFTAETGSFPSRLFFTPTASRTPVELLDPNPQLKDIRLGTQKRITWTNSDGEEVDGIVVFPPDYQEGQKYPLIVDVYPRPARDRFNLLAIPRMMGQMEAAKGYLVLQAGVRAPNGPISFSQDEGYTEKARGSRGISILVDDFNSGLDYLVKRGLVDKSSTCVYGHSMGGYVANFLMTEVDLKCVVVSSGNSNLMWTYFTLPPGDFPQEVASSGGDIFADPTEYLAMSPLFRMNKVSEDASILLITGDKDWWPWLPEMLLQFNALRHLGRDVTWVRYKEEGHAFVGLDNIKDSLDRIHRFFEVHTFRHGSEETSVKWSQEELSVSCCSKGPL